MEEKKTPLYEQHVKLGAKIVPFAGYLMPIQYQGILAEHRCVRETVGVFDVSHMGEFEVRGDKAEDFLQYITINDVSTLQPYQAQYSAMCYPDGGIVDDLLIYRFPDHFMVVVNASNLQKDFDWMNQHLINDVELTNRSDDYALIAVQGRNAQDTLQPLTDVDLSDIKYYWFNIGNIANCDAMIARTGYTGEDGFELMVPVDQAVQLWNTVMAAGKMYNIEAIGLGARDTLRLEVKYCLYGNDIDQTTNPLEAGLGWITKLDKGDFIARDVLMQVKNEGVKRKLIGFQMDGRAFARHGYQIYSGGRIIGHVTSGTMSPMLQKSIGMGYVEVDAAKVGTSIDIEIRNTHQPATVIKTPFYKRPY
ncbi:glycine cleavage system aminomethyltransferase GcvT [candidate division KSB1 bacterium]|nr:glycine cleavage system aminomethyltransferase GcvT [candidate division KSB1 bacterium]